MKNNNISISVNDLISLKIEKETANEIADGWKKSEVQWDELSVKDLFTTKGVMCGVLKNGETRRLKINLESLHSIMLDFDDGTPSFMEMQSRINNWGYPAVIFTSINHRKNGNGDRYRIWIPLKSPITVEEYSILVEHLKETFPTICDGISDATRYFYPSPCELFYFHNTGDEFYDAHLRINLEKTKIRRTLYKKTDVHFHKEDYVENKNNDIKQIADITEKTSIICPFCDPAKRTNPDRHNAFIDINKRGVYYISCSSEGKVRWQHPDEVDAYKKLDLWFSSENGSPVIIDDDGDLHHFVRRTDWSNYCIQEDIDEYCVEFLPRLKIKFRPDLEYGKNLDLGFFNIYKESEIIKKAKQDKIPSDIANLEFLKTKTPTIYKILDNLFGEESYIEHFMNWLGYIIQLKKKPFTAWIISSTPGAGKNMLFEKIITKILGKKYASIVGSDRLINKFNAMDTEIIIKGIDEVFLSNNHNINIQRKQFIKNQIGSTEKIIEQKGINSIKIDNYMSYILFTNESMLSFLIDVKDRRFNIIHNYKGIELATATWWMGRDKFEELVQNELYDFTRYIMSIEVDNDKANKTIDTKIKDLIAENSKEDYELLLDIIADEKWEELDLEDIESEVGDSIEHMLYKIKMYGGIPARYFKPLVKFYTGTYNLKIVRKLKAKGLKCIVTRRSNDTNMSTKIYKVERDINV